MTKDQAIREINMALIDSGNGHYQFDSIRDELARALRTPEDIIDDGEYGKRVFIKPPSGYEVEIEIETVEAALNG